jgi:histidine triad (HIT) family protein
VSDCLFCKIVAGEIPARVVAENSHCLAFSDIHPQAPVHVLVIPRQHVPGFSALTEADAVLIAHMAHLVNEVAARENVTQSGFRVVCNQGEHGGQTVGHLHWHVLGGRALKWPPG